MKMFDVIIIGSGPAGVSAAWPLVKSKKSVLMIDVGFDKDNKKENNINKEHTSPKILSKELSYAFRDFKEYYKLETQNFSAHGSLAKGGLSNAWSALTSSFSDDEFTDFPFTRKTLLPHYISVGKRIGVSGSKESNLSSWIGNEYVTQSSLPIHPLTQILLDNYNSNRLVNQNHKFILGKHNQAILSESLNNRVPFNQKNMVGFWDSSNSVYNSGHEIGNLKKNKNFKYITGFFVEEIIDVKEKCVIKANETTTKKNQKFYSKLIVLAAGTIGSTKLALKANKCFDKYFKIQNTPMFPFVLLFPLQLNRQKSFNYFSFWHLSYYLQIKNLKSHHKIFGHIAPTDGISSIELINRIKLPRPINSILGNFLWPKMLLGTCVFPGIYSDNKIKLSKNDQLNILGNVSCDLAILIKQSKFLLTKIFRRLGAFLLVKNLNIVPGEDVHYACTLPMKTNPKFMQTDQNGLLNGKGNIYIVDGSVLSSLPAKSHTFTIMANSERISKKIVQRL